MSRQARIRIPDGVYHVTTHGDGDRMIFEGPSEKWRLLDLLADTAKELDWAMYAWCVMGNHYHFLLKTPEDNLSEGMHHINMSYGEWYNKSRERHGHVFQDRFFSILITEDSHLLQASRYVVLNPLRAGLVSTPQEWRWSSYSTAVLGAPSRVSLRDRELMGMFGHEEAESRELYREFVQAGIGLKKPDFLLTGRARRWVESIDRAQSDSSQGAVPRKPVAGLTPDMMEVSRVVSLHRQGLSLRAIATALGISHMTVHRYLVRGSEETKL
jgi:REP element-mobilizing transposase RayT/DNA-binding CsgD family transcriptional regulator